MVTKKELEQLCNPPQRGPSVDIKGIILEVALHGSHQKRVKNPKKLIQSFDLTITVAHYSVREVQSNNDVIGPGYHASTSGVIPKAHYNVEGDKTIRKLVFRGTHPHLESGDQIKAYVLVGEQHERGEDMSEPETFYTPRKLQAKETAFKIEKLGPDGNVRATYCSIDDVFQKEV